MSTTMAVRIYYKEAKHAKGEGWSDKEQCASTNPNDSVRPPREEKASRIFGARVVTGVNRFPFLED
jgi:hypothetical protein